MPWNIVGNPWVSWSFYKTTIIGQITKWNESKIEKYGQKLLVLGRNLYVYLYIYLLLLLLFYNSSILDIEHSPYYIALGSPQTLKVI